MLAFFLASHLLFLTGQGHHREAAKAALEQTKLDSAVIEEMAVEMLRQGVQSSDSEEAMMALFGASVAVNEKAEALFESAYQNREPQIQLAALAMIARSSSEASLYIINQAIGHAHPLIRLEAAFMLAEKKAPQASIKIESLMHKMPPEIHFLFPRLFAKVGDELAKKNLKKLLNHPEERVRTEAILAIGEAGRDDFLKEIRRALTHPDVSSKEAAAASLGYLKDEASLTELEKAAKHPSPAVKVTSLAALVHLKQPSAEKELERLALEGNPFATYALAESPQAKETLIRLLKSRDRSQRCNATLALLELKEAGAKEGLRDLLIKDARDFCFIPIFSPAGAMQAYKVVSSASQNLEDAAAGFEMSLLLREKVLRQTLEVSDTLFFEAAHLILQQQQNDLVPLLMELIENKGSDEAKEFLKREEQRAGAPFIRAWAALALLRLKVEGPYEAKLQAWLKKEASLDLIRFRPFVPWEKREGNLFELTPNEKAALYVAILETFILRTPEKAVPLLLEMIANDAGKNRFILAGLLLHAIQ